MPEDINPATSRTPVEALLSQAIAEIQNVRPGERFMVRDLFRGYEWNRLSHYAQVALSADVSRYAQGDGSAVLTVVGKTVRGIQVYRKK